jgi:hypothetical protein
MYIPSILTMVVHNWCHGFFRLLVSCLYFFPISWDGVWFSRSKQFSTFRRWEDWEDPSAKVQKRHVTGLHIQQMGAHREVQDCLYSFYLPGALGMQAWSVVPI